MVWFSWHWKLLPNKNIAIIIYRYVLSDKIEHYFSIVINFRWRGYRKIIISSNSSSILMTHCSVSSRLASQIVAGTKPRHFTTQIILPFHSFVVYKMFFLQNKKKRWNIKAYCFNNSHTFMDSSQKLNLLNFRPPHFSCIIT